MHYIIELKVDRKMVLVTANGRTEKEVVSNFEKKMKEKGLMS